MESVKTINKRSVENQLEWNEALQKLPNPHLLQTWEWGDFKSRYGWKPTRFVWGGPSGEPLAAAQVLLRQVAPGFGILYCPRGPILDWSDVNLRHQVLWGLKDFTHQKNAIFLKIDPEVTVSQSMAGSDDMVASPLGEDVKNLFNEAGFIPSGEEIQFRNTMWLDLHPTNEEILAGMKQKTRYNIRLASKKGVKVILGTQDDFEMLYRMYAETSIRDRFTIRDWAYYSDVWNSFHHAGMAQPFIAAVEGKPVAGLILFRYREKAWFLYGMSRDQHRKKMPNHLLQWEAIKWAKATGSKIYDFWGAPDELDPSDPLWGVYRFKVGFGATFVKTIGAWDLINRPPLFRLYTSVMPRFLNLLRARGRSQIQRALE